MSTYNEGYIGFYLINVSSFLLVLIIINKYDFEKLKVQCLLYAYYA